MNRRNVSVFVLAACGLLLAATVQVQATSPRYAVTDLGGFFGSYFTRIGINNHGQVAFASDEGHAMLYCDGVMTDLGNLGSDFLEIRAINDSGQFVGTAISLDPEPYSCAFLYRDGEMIDLGNLDGEYTEPTYINNSGQVVGWCGGKGFLYSGGEMTSLGMVEAHDEWPPWPAGYAFGINNKGQVVGDDFLYSDAKAVCLESLVGYPSTAFAINDSGQIVGSTVTYEGETGQARTHAFLYSDGGMTYLDTLGGDWSDAMAINANGQVVGSVRYGWLSGPYFENAFLYSNGVTYDLRSLADQLNGWQWTTASDINDRGWITGFGMVGDEYHAFLLTPVPEPSAALLAALGLVGWLALARLRRQTSPGPVGVHKAATGGRGRPWGCHWLCQCVPRPPVCVADGLGPLSTSPRASRPGLITSARSRALLGAGSE
jgi:probable HAF family extracellular repeat protein